MTSKTFYELTKDSVVHVCVTLFDSVEVQSAIQFLEENNSIKELHILPGKRYHWELGLDTYLLDALYGQKKLRVLNLETRSSIKESQFIKFLQHPNAKLLKKIKITCIDGAYQERNDWICNASNLTHLKLGYNHLNTNTITKITNISRNLESIKIYGDLRLTPDEPKLNVTSILQANQKTLKEFHLKDCIYSEEDVMALVQCTQLESLSLLLNCRRISMQTLNMIIENKHLKTLHLNFWNESPTTYEELEDILCMPNLSQLTSLHLTSRSIIHPDILSAIASLKNLKDLCLDQDYAYGMNLYEVTYEDLGVIIKNCKKLEKLILHVDLEYQRAGFKKLIGLPNLKIAGIHSHKGFPENLKFVVNCLRKSKSIKMLCFSRVTFYRDKKSKNKMYWRYEEFYDSIQGAVLELNNAFKFTEYDSPNIPFHFDDFCVFQ